MIRRDRNTAPAELIEKHEDWTGRFDADPELDYLREWDNFKRSTAGTLTNDALSQMYDQKCCYCEIKTGDRIVEHFLPKSSNRRRMFEYENLHLVCSGCNSKKGNKDTTNVIDPSSEDPSQHLIFKTQEASFLDEKGRVSIACVELNRKVLLNLRQTEITLLKRRIESIHGHLLEDLTLGSLRRHLVDVQNIRTEYFSLSAPFSKALQDNFGHLVDGLEFKINEMIQAL